MALVTSPVPQIGVANASEQVDATNLLTEIKNLLNGSLGVDNLSAALRTVVAPPLVSSLPGDPIDGDRVAYRPAPGILWPLRYNASAVGPYKWEADGAAEYFIVFGAGGSIASNTTIAPIGAASPYAMPFSGVYQVAGSVTSIAFGGIAPSSAVAVQSGVYNGTTGGYRTVFSTQTLLAGPAQVALFGRDELELAAGDLVQHGIDAYGASATCVLNRCVMSIKPIRVG